MNVAIIGCGLIGLKRMKALSLNDNLLAICDKNINKIKKNTILPKANLYKSYYDLLKIKEIETVIVAVENYQAYQIVIDCLKLNKKVLCEKPLGTNVFQARNIFSLSKKLNLPVKVGFNHRYHPAINLAKKYVEDGRIGEIINIRSFYGHGGRPGMEKEWRSSKKKCGGGELIDQGIHLIDLFRWFCNSEAKRINGEVWNSFWKIKVEDNAYFNIQMKNKIMCNAHVSWTNWKNEFYFCIFGTKGYIKIEGLGGSYGQETLEIGIKKKKGGRPEIKSKFFKSKDISWKKEWNEFKSCLKQNKKINCNANDGLRAMQIIEGIYKSSKNNKSIVINAK